MKKLIITLLILSMAVVLGACSRDAQPEVNPEEVPSSSPAEAPAESPQADLPEAETPVEAPSEEASAVSDLTVEDLYPFEKDVTRVYQGTGIEFAWFDQYVDFLEGNRIQLRENNGGTEIVRVLEKKEGTLREIINLPETYYKENMLSKMPNTDRILLKEPIAVGTTWKNDNESNVITAVDMEIDTPYGTLLAVEVTRKADNDGSEYTNIDYYSEGLGLIKTVNLGDGYEVTSSLEKLERGVPRKKVINFYYPNANDERIFLYRKELIFTTNDIPRNKIVEAYKNLPKEAAPVLSENTAVNYLYLNRDGMVYVDLSQEFVDEMNAGAGYESLILQSLANTFGDYYGADKIMLTVEGETYESGHILLEKFEPIEVNYDSIVDKN